MSGLASWGIYSHVCQPALPWAGLGSLGLSPLLSNSLCSGALPAGPQKTLMLQEQPRNPHTPPQRPPLFLAGQRWGLGGLPHFPFYFCSERSLWVTFHRGGGWEKTRGPRGITESRGPGCQGVQQGRRNGQEPGITPDLPVLLTLPLCFVQETTELAGSVPTRRLVGGKYGAWNIPGR